MKLLIFLFALLGLTFSYSHAAEAFGNFADKNHPGKCNINGWIVSPGNHKKPKECMEVLCKANGDVIFETCGVKSVPGCKAGSLVDKTKRYPECCKQNFICKDGTIQQF